MNKFFIFHRSLLILMVSSVAFAADMGVPIQLRLKSPTGEYPTASGINFKLTVLTPTSNCVLREENFNSQSINEGSISLNLGSGSRGANDPNLSLNQVYDNSKIKTGLICIDANNNVVSTGQSYVPTASDRRVIRITATVGADLINVNFNMRSTPYAIQAESVGGKVATDILTQDTSTQLNQVNLADLLFDVTRFNNLKTLATTGAATTATNFTGSLTGDVTGGQSSTVVTKIRGVSVSTSTPNTGDVLQYNGSQYVPVAIPSAPVTSVAGRTGSITLTTTDISGLGGAALLNVGTTAGTVAAGDDSRIVSAYAATSAATAGNSPSTLVKRDASGNVAVSNLSSVNASTNNLYLYSGANSVHVLAPVGLSANYTLVLPPDDGAVDQVLKTDGSGNLSWGNPAAAGVSTVSASVPLASSGGANPIISITQANGSTAGYLSAADWTTFNSKQNALGYVPLDEAVFNNAVASASCTTSQTLYWNSVTSQFLCQNISFPSAPVTSVAGRTGDVTLTASDISGLGGAALLNVGTTAGTVAAGDDVRIVSAYNATNAATSTNTANTIVKRDASGNFAAGIIQSTSLSTNNVYYYSGANSVLVKAPAGLAATYVLTLPADDGTSNQVLTTDGSGNLSWGNPAAAGVSSVTASAPLASSGGANPNLTITQANGTTAGYLSAADWTTFNNKQAALGYTPLDEAVFNNAVASASCTTSQTLYWNSVSSQFLCQNISFPSAPVTSVAGRTGDITLSASDISGLGGAALLNVGTTAGTVAAGDDSRIVSSNTAVTAATALNTASTIVKRDASGNFAAGALSITSNNYFSGANSVQMRAPAGLAASYTLTLPADDGTNNQVLTTDGSGNLSWGNPAAAGVSSVTASAPLASSGGGNPNISITQANGTTAGYLSAADWTTFNNKQAALGFTPLDQAYFNNAVASANCTTSQSLYWNSVSSQFLCQNIVFPSVPVTSVAGRTGDITLSASDISGLGGAALLNVGTTAGTVAAGDDSRIVSSNNAITAATSTNTASTLVKRDPSGNFAGSALSVNNVYYFSGANSVQLRAPAGLGGSYTLTLPADDGTNNQVLTTDGSGNLSWQAPATGSVLTVTASAPLSSSGGANPNITISQANGTTAGYLAAADWTTFNNKQAALGFTPLDQAYFNTAVSSGSCTSTQMMYWNSVSSQFMCQTVPVTSVAGRTGAITLSNTDISGLGTAATQNVGTAVGNVVQLDGTSRIPASTLPTVALTTSSTFSGDVSGTSSTMSVDKLKGTAVSATAPTTGQALVYNGTAWVPTTGFPKLAKITADQTISSVGQVAVTGLSFAVTAGVTYKYKFNVVYTSNGLTRGMSLGLTYPAVTTASARVTIPEAVDGVASMFFGVINASGDFVSSANSPEVAPNQLFATVEGVILPSASGTVQLTSASETGGSNVIIANGSNLEVMQMP